METYSHSLKQKIESIGFDCTESELYSAWSALLEHHFLKPQTDTFPINDFTTYKSPEISPRHQFKSISIARTQGKYPFVRGLHVFYTDSQPSGREFPVQQMESVLLAELGSVLSLIQVQRGPRFLLHRIIVIGPMVRCYSLDAKSGQLVKWFVGGEQVLNFKDDHEHIVNHLQNLRKLWQ